VCVLDNLTQPWFARNLALYRFAKNALYTVLQNAYRVSTFLTGDLTFCF
jgi:hypothetical protein